MQATINFLIWHLIEGAGPDGEGEEIETELLVEVYATAGDPRSSDPWDQGEFEVLEIRTVDGQPWAGALTTDELARLSEESGHLFDPNEGPDWDDYREELPEYYDGR